MGRPLGVLRALVEAVRTDDHGRPCRPGAHDYDPQARVMAGNDASVVAVTALTMAPQWHAGDWVRDSDSERN